MGRSRTELEQKRSSRAEKRSSSAEWEKNRVEEAQKDKKENKKGLYCREEEEKYTYKWQGEQLSRRVTEGRERSSRWDVEQQGRR